MIKETKYDGYYVDDVGNVYSTWVRPGRWKKKTDMRMLKPGVDKTGRKLIRINGKSIRIHRLIWETFNSEIPEGMVVDHKDINPSNNRLDNLRLATTTQNRRNESIRVNNTSGYKGVHFNKKRRHYQAYIKTGNIHKYLGSFKTAEEASKAYDEAAVIYFKEFAATNKELVK